MSYKCHRSRVVFKTLTIAVPRAGLELASVMVKGNRFGPRKVPTKKLEDLLVGYAFYRHRTIVQLPPSTSPAMMDFLPSIKINGDVLANGCRRNCVS